MLSKDVSAKAGISDRHVRNLTQKAIGANKKIISCKGESFSFTKVAGIGGRGWVYSYTPITMQPTKKPKRKVCRNFDIDLTSLPAIKDLNKPTTDEKIALIAFYNTSKHPLGHIVKALIMNHNADIKPDSLQAKVKRWIKTFKEKGRAGLEDKRGGKAFKADLDLVEFCLFGAGTRHYTSAYLFYCHQYALRHGTTFNIRAPKADISSSTFYRTAKHIAKQHNLLKEFLHIGFDCFTYAEPSIGREWQYPNEQWEVDATPNDMMVKVPVDENGVRNYWLKEPTENYHLVRPQIIGIIDNKSGATVYGLRFI